MVSRTGRLEVNGTFMGASEFSVGRVWRRFARRRQDRGVRDTELYRHLLGLVAPWEVSQVELSVEDGRVDVWVEHPKRTRFLCPDCDVELAVYDHSEERVWRHLDSCAFLTFLHASRRWLLRRVCRTPRRPAIRCAGRAGWSHLPDRAGLRHPMSNR